MKKRITYGAFALLTISALGSHDVAAQTPEEGRRVTRGPAIESIMSMRERLELNDAQLSTLDRIRAERVQDQSARQAEMAEMRSRLRAGEIRQSEMMAFLEDRADARRNDAGGLRAEVEAVLNEDQIEMLDDLRTRSRAFVRGRTAARGERGVRGSRPGRDGPRSLRGTRGPRMDDDRFDRRRSRRGGFDDNADSL